MGGKIRLAGDLRYTAFSGPDRGDAINASGETTMDDDDCAKAIQSAVERSVDR